MELVNKGVINVYSIVIMIVIYVHCLRHDGKSSIQYKFYIRMIQLTILMLVVDILSRFDGNPGTIYSSINYFGNILLFLLNPILPSYWLLYVHYQVFMEEGKTRKLYYPLFAINAINAIMIALTQIFGWVYYIDSENIYHRGPVFFLPDSITMILIIVAFILSIAKRKKIEHKHYFSLVFFPVIPFVCVILHTIFYDISIALNSVVISLMLVFLNIQNHSIYTDYLTGVNNRKKLDSYLKDKISTSNNNKTFSAILIDLNNFKSINDNFGHDMGDEALRIAVKLLRNCMKSKEFIARFGGDEFCIVLDVSDRIILEEVVSKINNCVKKYNESNEQPYEISFSMGYAVYDYHSHMNVEEFQKQIDMLMYENKQDNKGESHFVRTVTTLV